MRDYVLTLIIVCIVPVCLMRPWLGFIAWFWLGLMNPHRLTWGFAYSMPFAMWIGGATLLGMVFAKDRRPVPWTSELVLMVVLLAYFTMTCFFAWAPAFAWPQLEKVAKIILMTILVGMFIYGKQRIYALLFTIALSLGFYGFKGGIWSILHGGAERVQGPENSFLDGNTFIGLALNMVLPLILFLARDSEKKWMKYGLYLTAFLTVISIIFTYSRGAYLGLAAILPFLVWRARYRWFAIIFLGGGILAAPFVLPDKVFERAEQIENYQEDGSANQRLQSWTVAWNIAMDRPLTGAGFEFEFAGDDERWFSYGSEKYNRFIHYSSAAHSIYFQVLGQHGFVALALFLAMVACSMLRLQRLRRLSSGSADTQWIGGAATALQIGLVGYVVSGAFLSSAYFDLAYLYYALGAILAREARASVVVTEHVSPRVEGHMAKLGSNPRT